MLDVLYEAVPALNSALEDHLLVNNQEVLWNALRSLLLAHAPSGGCNLPGAILDGITLLVQEFGLKDRFIPYIGSTGNAGVWLGVEKSAADVIIVAHMDRPSFRIRSLTAGELFPICANRFSQGSYHTPAKALRFEDGKIVVSARGTLISEREGGHDALHIRVESGSLAWQDTILIDAQPGLNNGKVTGTGLDNCLGVIVMLGAAAILRQLEEAMWAQNRRCLFIFTDQEEGVPEAFFGHGAARLMHTLPPPTFGCIISDAHGAIPNSAPFMGQGVSHGSVSAWGRGSIVPPNYLSLAIDLAQALNSERDNTVQINTGYLSRSDDMALGRWTQILGLIGVPMTNAHTGHETAQLADIPNAIWWLSHFATAVLGLSPKIARNYVLFRENSSR